MCPNTPVIKTKAILKTYAGKKITAKGKLHVREQQNNQALLQKTNQYKAFRTTCRNS